MITWLSSFSWLAKFSWLKFVPKKIGISIPPFTKFFFGSRTVRVTRNVELSSLLSQLHESPALNQENSGNHRH